MAKIVFEESQFINAKNFKTIGGSNKQALALTIEECEYNDRIAKYVCTFQENNKKFALNVTNLKALCSLYGEDTDGFRYQPINLILSSVLFNGEMVDSIKVVV